MQNGDVRPLSRYLTRQEVAHLLGIDTRTLHRWVQKGWMPPPIRLAPARRRVRWQRDVIEAFVQRLEADHAAPCTKW